MTYIMKSYVISMDDDVGKDRRRKFYIDCKDAGFDLPAWHKGVKIDQVPPDAMEKHVSNLCSSFCTNGMIGCGLAHRFLYEKHVDDTEPILIFEDDARLTLGFVRKLESVIQAMSEVEFDLLLLGCQSDCGTSGRDTISKVRRIHGAHAYIISSQGRRNMLAEKLSKHIDIQMSDMAKAGRLKAFYVTPDLSFADAGDMANSLNSPPTGFPNSVTSVLNTAYNSKGLPMSRHFTAGLFQVGMVQITQMHFILFVLGLILGMHRPFVWWFFALDVAIFPSDDPVNVVTSIMVYTLGGILNNFYIMK
jgi:hypothetical protein